MNTVLATKQYMSQVFSTDGVRLPVTVVRSGPHTVVSTKTQEKDGYWAMQFGFGERKIKGLTKPRIGHLKGALKEDKKAPRFLREVRLEKDSGFKVGTTVNPAEVLDVGDLVNVTGVSKGKGFAGGVKRHGFHGGPKTHGQSDRHRAPGSIGQTTTPGRVYKGKRMAGRMGGEQNTIKNLVVLKVDEKSGEILLSGLIPGAPGALLILKKVGKSKKQYNLVTDQTELPEVDESAPAVEETEEKVDEPSAQVEKEENSSGSQTE